MASSTSLRAVSFGFLPADSSESIAIHSDVTQVS